MRTITPQAKKKGVTAPKQKVKSDIISNTIIHQKPEHREETIIPDSLHKKHWDEWVNSGVNEYIIRQNVTTVDDSYVLDKLLDINNKKRWKHSDNLVPGWAVRGIEPTTGENVGLGLQFKSDNPRENLEGKIVKYESVRGYENAPLFLDVESKNYWQEIAQDKSIPIVITEGAKKAGCLLSHNYAAISLPGVSSCRKLGVLHEWIKLFCGFGRTFYLCFDSDILVKRPVYFALLGLARELSATGSKVMVISLPEGEDKGVDDFIVNQGVERFEKLYQSANTIEQWKLDQDLLFKERQEIERKRRTSIKAWKLEQVEKHWGEYLRWNELTKEPELNGDVINAQFADLQIAQEIDLDVTKEFALDALAYVSKRNSYHPVQQYLENVAREHQDIDTSILDNLASRYLGNDSEICNIYLKKMMVGAVGRALMPEYKFDNATIFHGGEGAKKSTFFEVLFGGTKFFTSSIDAANTGKDEKQIIHQYWGIEWGEFSTVYKRKDVEQLKQFLAEKVDTVRLPYDRKPSVMPRRCVFVGTTNRPDILQDVEGRNRRFWIITVKVKQINLEQLREERDKLWAAAYKLFEQGEKSYIEEYSREARLQDIENQQYKVKPAIFEDVEAFLDDKNECCLGEIYDYLGIEKGRKDFRSEKAIRDCLSLLGWESTEERRRINGGKPRLWKPKKKDIPENSETGGTPGQNACNQDISIVSDVPPSVPPLSHPEVERDNTVNCEVSHPHENPGQVGHQVGQLELLPQQDYSQSVPVSHPKTQNRKATDNQENLKRLNYQIHIITAPPGQYEWVDASLVEYRPNEYDHRKDKWVFLRDGHEYSINDIELIRLKPN